MRQNERRKNVVVKLQLQNSSQLKLNLSWKKMTVVGELEDGESVDGDNDVGPGNNEQIRMRTSLQPDILCP